MTRSHVHEEVFPVTAEALFQFLVTPSSIREWWGASSAIILKETGGLWAATWGDEEDDPDYVSAAKIAEYSEGQKLVLTDYQYQTKAGGLPFDADFVTTFEVTPHSDGASLKVTQDGFPDDAIADDFYAGCQKGWSDTFDGIRRFVESRDV